MWLLFQNVICNADHCDQQLKSKIEGVETVDSGLVSDCVVVGSTAVVTGTTANSFFLVTYGSHSTPILDVANTVAVALTGVSKCKKKKIYFFQLAL